jgi:hypothetical protein
LARSLLLLCNETQETRATAEQKREMRNCVSCSVYTLTQPKISVNFLISTPTELKKPLNAEYSVPSVQLTTWASHSSHSLCVIEIKSRCSEGDFVNSAARRERLICCPTTDAEIMQESTYVECASIDPCHTFRRLRFYLASVNDFDCVSKHRAQVTRLKQWAEDFT